MRIRISKCATLFIVVFNLLLFFGSWKYFMGSENSPENQGLVGDKTTTKPRDRIQEANKFLRRSITVIFRDFYHFDNDMKSCIDHLLNLVPDMRILVIADELPYPPMNIFASSFTSNQTSAASSLIYKENVQFLNLDRDLSKTASERNPLNHIQTKYVLFLPDGFRLSNGRQLFQRIIRNLGQNSRDKSQRKIIVVPFMSNHKDINYCFQINSDIPMWTLEYEVKNTTKNCNMVKTFPLIILKIIL